MPALDVQPPQQQSSFSGQSVPFFKNEVSGDTIREVVDNSKLREILDAYLYSAIAVDIKIPRWKNDYDEKGKKIKRKVDVKSTVYQKLPNDLKVVSCLDFGIEDCDYAGYDKDSDTPLCMEIEFSEADVLTKAGAEGELKDFRDHLLYKHNLDVKEQAILKQAKFKDWHPIMNRSGTDSCKSYIMGLTSPVMSTTLYKEDELDKLKHSAILDAKAIVRTIIQNHRAYKFDYEDSTKVSMLMTFFFDLVFAVRSRNINGFMTRSLFSSTNRVESVNLNPPIIDKGLKKQWSRIVNSR